MRRVVPEPFPDPMVRDAVAFGQAVRAARTSAGISLEAAAAALGVSKATLGDLEGGKGTVALGTAIRVARDLGAALFVAPLTVHFDAATALQNLRSADPSPWGGSVDPAPAIKPRRAERSS